MTSTGKLDVTGVVGVSCRHAVVMANGVVDLHKGERYRYVDIAIICALRLYFALGLSYLILSYDIACKYYKNFEARVSQDPYPIVTPEELLKLFITWLVPKFHLGGHQADCSDNFSFNYTQGVGRTHGEHVEPIWALHNHLKHTTREMSHALRIETITDHLHSHNWQKKTDIGQ